MQDLSCSTRWRREPDRTLSLFIPDYIGQYLCLPKLFFGSVLCIGVAGFGVPADAQSDSGVGLQEVLAAVYASDPRLNAERARILVRSESLTQARFEYRPRVDLEARAGYGSQATRFSSSPSAQVDGLEFDVGITVLQPVFRGFRRKNKVARLESEVEAQRLRLVEVSRAIFLDTAKLYFEILLAERQVESAIEREALANEQFGVAKAKDEAGVKSGFDTALFELELASARTNLVSKRARLTLLEDQLRRRAGLVAVDLKPDPSLPEMPRDLGDFLGEVYQSSASIKRAEADLRAAIHAVSESKATYYPSVDIELTAGRDSGSVNFGLFTDDQTTESLRASIKGTVPLYTGGQRSSSVRKAKHSESIARYNLAAEKLQVEESARQLWLAFKQTENIFEAQRQRRQLAERAADRGAARHASGVISLSELLSVQEELYDSRTRYDEAMRDRHVAAWAVVAQTDFLDLEAVISEETGVETDHD